MQQGEKDGKKQVLVSNSSSSYVQLYIQCTMYRWSGRYRATWLFFVFVFVFVFFVFVFLKMLNKKSSIKQCSSSSTVQCTWEAGAQCILIYVHCAFLFVFVKPLHMWSGMRVGDVRRSATFRLLNLMALIYPELILARRPWFESEGPKADIFASFASLRLPGRLQALFFMHQFETSMGLSRPRSESF